MALGLVLAAANVDWATDYTLDSNQRSAYLMRAWQCGCLGCHVASATPLGRAAARHCCPWHSQHAVPYCSCWALCTTAPLASLQLLRLLIQTPPPHADLRNKAGSSVKVSIGAIVGGVVGAIALIALTATLVIYCKRRRSSKAQKQYQQQGYMAPSPTTMGSGMLPSYGNPFDATRSTNPSMISSAGGGGYHQYGDHARVGTAGSIAPLVGSPAGSAYATSVTSTGQQAVFAGQSGQLPVLGPAASSGVSSLSHVTAKI